MDPTADQVIGEALVALVTLIVVAYLLYLLIGALRRSRPDAAIGRPIAVALAVRVLVLIGFSVLGWGELRRTDEFTFLNQAHNLVDGALGSPSWIHFLTERLHVFVFAAQIDTLNSTELALRIAQAGISVAGLTLLAFAVYELAGARAAVIAAWILALEPTNIFFSVVLHKEPNMMLAGGLVAFGGAALWKRASLVYVAPIAIGCLMAVATRPYVGWFLIAASAAIILHAGIQHRQQEALRSLTLIAGMVLFGALSAPIVWEASSEEGLEDVQQRQERIVAPDPGSSLDLEEVDYSTRWQVLLSLPQRIRDIVVRPYPWQVANLSQRLGLIGTLIAWTVLFLLIRELVIRRRQIMQRAAPLIYVGLFLMTAYTLSAGNAGTAFRYRTHIVAVAIVLVVTLWAQRTREAAREHERDPRARPLSPVPATQYR